MGERARGRRDAWCGVNRRAHTVGVVGAAPTLKGSCVTAVSRSDT
jgi:hypothetical protein